VDGPMGFGGSFFHGVHKPQTPAEGAKASNKPPRITRGSAGSLLCFASGVFAAPAHSQTHREETLSGPDSHEMNPGDQVYLFGDWDGTRTRLRDRGVRFDFFYASDMLWGFESQEKGKFAVGIASEAQSMSILVRSPVCKGGTFMPPHSRKEEVTSGRS